MNNEVYMGKKSVDKDTFQKATAYLESLDAEKKGTSVGDPPTCCWYLNGEIKAQYFVAFMHVPERYYVAPDILELINYRKRELNYGY